MLHWCWGASFNISQLEDLLNEDDNEKNFKQSQSTQSEFSGSLNTASELPDWLINQLKQNFNEEEILQFGRSVAQPAPLDVRVNTLNGKRNKVLAQLQTEFPQAIATPFAPHGIRFPEQTCSQQTRIILKRHAGSAR